MWWPNPSCLSSKSRSSKYTKKTMVRVQSLVWSHLWLRKYLTCYLPAWPSMFALHIQIWELWQQLLVNLSSSVLRREHQTCTCQKLYYSPASMLKLLCLSSWSRWPPHWPTNCTGWWRPQPWIQTACCQSPADHPRQEVLHTQTTWAAVKLWSPCYSPVGVKLVRTLKSTLKKWKKSTTENLEGDSSMSEERPEYCCKEFKQVVWSMEEDITGESLCNINLSRLYSTTGLLDYVSMSPHHLGYQEQSVPWTCCWEICNIGI